MAAHVRGGRMPAATVLDVVARYELTGTAPPAVPGQWGQAVTTAVDLARFLARPPVIADPGDAGTQLSWMQAATPVAVIGSRVVVLLSEVPQSVSYDRARASLTTAAGALPRPLTP